MRPLRLLLLTLLAVSVSSCDGGPGESLYDPDAPRAAAPVIASISPDGPLLAGIDEITIAGQNFSATPSDNLVFFDDGAGAVAQGTILSASATELRVKVPNLPNEDLRVRVAVTGALDFSNPVPLPLVPAFVPFGDLDPAPGSREGAAAIASDGVGGLYVSVARGSGAGGVVRFTPEGVRESVSTVGILWDDLAHDPASARLFASQAVQAIFELPSGSPVMPILASGVRISALTPGGDGGLWAGGSAGTPTRPQTPNLYRFDLAGNVTATEFPGIVADLGVFDGHLYVAATRSGDSPEAKVWRLPILSDGTLGAEEVVYDVAADQPGRRPSALAIAADGTVFVGIAPPASDPRAAVEHPLIQVAPDGTAAPLYPGVLPSPVRALAWGAGSSLYLVRSQILPPAGEAGEPTPSAIFKVEARKQGA